MTTLSMNGPFNLTSTNIESIITNVSAGNYALGYVHDNIFTVEYVGRSDTDVKDRLKTWVGKYKSFKYSYSTSPKEAFKKECMNYHDFGENERLDNKAHPDRPDNSDWECPICNIYDK
jgi:hypothetical protein